MRIDRYIEQGHLDPTFPLPTAQPFTYAAAVDAGLRREHLAALCRGGLLARPIKRVYVPTALGDSLAVRAACLRLVVPDDCVVVDRHAGWLLGAQMILAPNEHLELRPLSVFRPSGRGRLRNGLANSGERNLRRDDVVEIEGLQVTTPLRTAWDLGRVRWVDEAICGLDAMFRLSTFSREEFLDGIERFRRMRWVTTLRAVGPLADGRAESPGESVLRLRCIENHLRGMSPQVEVLLSSGRPVRFDLADEELMAAVEYDGAEWHTTDEQVDHDLERRAEARDDGWRIEAFRADDIFGPHRVVDERLGRLRQEARRRRGLRCLG